MKQLKSAAVASAVLTKSTRGTHSLDRSQEIMTVALQLFAERGFADVTIKDIAGRLRINTALIYYYFKNKEDLFRACLEAAVYDAMASYDAIRGGADHPAERINSWFNSNIELAPRIANMVKVMMDYAGSALRLPSVDRLIGRFYEEERRLLARAINEGVASGVFQAVDGDRLAQFVSTHLDGIMVASIIRSNLDIVDAVSTLRGILFESLGYKVAGKIRRKS
jgi:AcrR family transcriptional regulator